MKNELLEKLAAEKSSPCVTISMNTHRTSPDNLLDIIGLKNLLKEAHDRVVNEFGKRPAGDLLEKMDQLENEIDVNYNLESIHVFLSNSTQEIVRSSWPVSKNTVNVSETFDIKPIIKIFNRAKDYLIMVLSQSEVRLLHAVNDSVLDEIRNDDFPFAKNPHFMKENENSSDGKHVDNLVREFFNTIDKAVVKVHLETKMKVVVICTENNWSRLLQVADNPSIYYGYASVNYNNKADHTLAADAWPIIKSIQINSRAEAILEIKEAVGQGKVITDLSEIFKAAKEGRGDLLITHDDYRQAVRMTGEFTFELITDVTLPEAIDDISSDIAREVISKKGRVLFTDQEALKTLGSIVLKVRY